VHTAAAVSVILFGIWLLRRVWGRANPGARLAAIGSGAFALWLMVAIASMPNAMKIAAFTASGVAAFAAGIGHFAHAL